MGLTINTGAQLQGEPRTACYALLITFYYYYDFLYGGSKESSKF